MASQERIKLIQAEAKATERLKQLQAEKTKAEKDGNTAYVRQLEDNIKKIEKFKEKVEGVKEAADSFKSITESMNLSSRATSELTKNLGLVNKQFNSIASLDVKFNFDGQDELRTLIKGADNLGELQSDLANAEISGDKAAIEDIQGKIQAAEGFIQKAQQIQSIQQDILNWTPDSDTSIEDLTDSLTNAQVSLGGLIKSNSEILKQNPQLGSSLTDYLTATEKVNKELIKNAGLTEEQIAAQKKLTQGAEEMAGKVSAFGNMLTAVFKSPFTIVGGIVIGMGKILSEVGKTTREMGGFVGGLTGATSQVTVLKAVFPQALESAKGLSSEFGGLSDTSFETQFNTNLLATNLGVSGKEASQLVGQFARLNNGSVGTAENLIASTKELAKQKGLVPSSVMADVAGSAQAFAEYGKAGGKNIAEAAVAAGQLGTNLATATKVTDHLLDFENSINQELELGARLGRNINFQEARRLAYQGDIRGALQSALQQMGGIEGFNRMDIFQKRAAAAALGLQTDEMQKMLANMDNLNKDGSIQVSQFDQMKETLTAVVTGPMGSMVEKLGMLIMGLPFLTKGLAVLGPLGKVIAAPFKLIFGAVNGILRGMKFLVVESAKFVANMVKAAAQKLGFGGAEAGAALNPFEVAKSKGLSDKQILAGFGGKEAKDMMAIPESVTDKATDSIADKAKDKVSDKAEDLVDDKLDSVADKISDKAEGVAPDESIGGKLTSLASGLSAMGTGQVLKGALNLIPTALGFIAILPGIPGMFLVGKTGISAGKGLIGLAAGLTAMNGTLGGSTSLAVAGLGFTLMTAGALGMGVAAKLGVAAGQGLIGLAPGLVAMTGTIGGSTSLILAGLGFSLMTLGIPGMIGVATLGTAAGLGLLGLAPGLLAMTPTILGSTSLILAGLGFSLMVPGLIGMAGVAALGAVAGTGLLGLAPGLIAMTAGLVGAGVLALTGLGFSLMIPGLVGMGGVALLGVPAGLGLVGLATGLMAMIPTLAGSTSLILAGLGFSLMIPGLIGMGGVALLGAPAGAGLIGLAAGLMAMTPTVVGSAALLLAASAFTLMIPGSIGMLMMGAAAPIAALGIFALIPALTALGGLMASGVGALGLLALVGMAIGLASAFTLIGAGAMMFGKGIELAANSLGSFLPKLSNFMESISLGQVATIGLLSLAFIGLAGALMFLGAAGLFALPTLLGIAAASAGIAVVAELFGLGGEGKTEETTALEPESVSTFEKDVLGKIDQLIQAVNSGMQVNLDGRQVSIGLERTSGRSLQNNALVRGE